MALGEWSVAVLVIVEFPRMAEGLAGLVPDDERRRETMGEDQVVEGKGSSEFEEGLPLVWPRSILGCITCETELSIDVPWFELSP